MALPARKQTVFNTPGLVNKRLGQFLTYAVLILFVFYFLCPIGLVWFTALKTPAELNVNPFSYPRQIEWSNLSRALQIGKFGQYLKNTLIYNATIVTGVCALASLMGYALARLKVPGRNLIFWLLMLRLMVPFQSIMSPLFYLARDLGLLGSRWAFILPGIALGLPFGTFMMRAFFRGLPNELAEAAKIDGCTEWSPFYKVMLPLAKPGLLSLAVFQFMWTWNDLLMPLVMVQKDANQSQPASTTSSVPTAATGTCSQPMSHSPLCRSFWSTCCFSASSFRASPLAPSRANFTSGRLIPWAESSPSPLPAR